MDYLKELIATRGVQLIARYGANALIALGTKLAVTVNLADATATATVAGTFIAAGICWAIDHFSHAKQQDA